MEGMMEQVSEKESASGMLTVPETNERPTVFAERLGDRYAAEQSRDHRNAHGLYVTPVAVADFMAAQVQVRRAKVRVSILLREAASSLVPLSSA